jgi:hypothetical protein
VAVLANLEHLTAYGPTMSSRAKLLYWVDPYDGSYASAVSWVEEFLHRELAFILAFEQELVALGLLPG